MNTKEKLRLLLASSFTLKQKILLSLSLGFALSFTFIFFGTLDIFFNNSTDILFQITFGNVLGFAVVALFIVWLLVSGFLVLMPGKFFIIACSLCLGALVAGYMQAALFNNWLHLGTLIGGAIPWHTTEYLIRTIVNTFLWMIIIAIPFFLYYFSKNIWRKSALIVCLLLVGMQGVVLVPNLVSAAGGAFATTLSDEEHVPFLSTRGAFEVSSENNVIFFVVDCLDGKYVDAVREYDPYFFDRLDGFTEFTNATQLHSGTFPAMPYLLTGYSFNYDMLHRDFLDYAWANGLIIPYLRDNNYTTFFHMFFPIFADISQLYDLADNISYGYAIMNYRSIAANFLRMSAYRYAPAALKPSFFLPAVNFNTTFETDGYPEIIDDDVIFFERFRENSGLTIQEGSNNKFSLIHLWGAHPPYWMDENAQRREDWLPTDAAFDENRYLPATMDVVRQTMGTFKIIFEFLDEMKRLGVYEDATIVILADHGDYFTSHKTIGFFVKPSGSAGTPLVQNNAPVSHSNLWATIFQSEGLGYAPFGVSAFDIPEYSNLVRRVIIYRWNGAGEAFTRAPASVLGDANNPANWHFNPAEEFYWSVDGRVIQ